MFIINLLLFIYRSKEIRERESCEAESARTAIQKPTGIFMSISPSLNQGSTSSSSSSTSQSPTSNHGFRPFNHPQQQQNLQSSPPPPPPSHLSGGRMPPSAHSQGGSTKEVKGRERRNHGKSPFQQHAGKNSPPEDVAHLKVGSTEWRSKPSGTDVSVNSHQSAASLTSQMSSGHSSGRKAQAVNCNHLLNFHYDPVTVSRPQYRAPPPRRQPKRRPYNKDLFFQANYKFVVLDTGNYATESIDPDKMLCWEDIICLKYSTPFPVQCPICLDDPLCPQITSCGHIFCFPCILQYFSMGEDDPKSECWKKCPLCFTMISSKDLYTIRVENVKQYHQGDEIDFVLLHRKKDSFSSSLKDNENNNIEDEILDSFSKFTLTSDVELSVREAMSDLDSWIARADSGLVDDIEKLPYVCAAMEQLERRKKYWNEHRTSDFDKAKYESPPTADSDANYGASGCSIVFTSKNEKSGHSEKSSPNKVIDEFCAHEVTDIIEPIGDKDRSVTSSSDENKKNPQTLSNGTKESKAGDSYNFYQAIDGQHLILHPFNMKCLLHHYGSYEKLPSRISGKILQLETVTQSEAVRRRYRFLSHLSLTTTFQLCEIDLGSILPSESLSPFMDEIKNRETQRKQLARKELKDKIKSEVANSQFVLPYYSHDAPPSFSMDDFEALGSPTVASSGPSTAAERLTFSSVARLGFAAGHDSPVQIAPKIDPSHGSAAIGWKNSGASFANVTSRSKHEESPHMAKANEVGKKGKKASKILLSTSGGRRY